MIKIFKMIGVYFLAIFTSCLLLMQLLSTAVSTCIVMIAGNAIVMALCTLNLILKRIFINKEKRNSEQEYIKLTNTAYLYAAIMPV